MKFTVAPKMGNVECILPCEDEAEGRKLIDTLEREWADIKGEVARARERLQDFRAKDETGLIDREKSAAQRFGEADRKAQEAEQDLSDKRKSAEVAAKKEKDARTKRSATLKKGASLTARSRAWVPAVNRRFRTICLS